MNTVTPPRLFCFGLGYSALNWAKQLRISGWQVSGSCQSRERQAELGKLGFDAVLYNGGHFDEISKTLDGITHVLVSVPPDAKGDPVYRNALPWLRQLPDLKWLGYLSTTGVYGNTDGKMVDETAPLNPTSKRSQWRIKAEQQWLDAWRNHGLPVHIFRLSGIYGPGRSPLERVKAGRGRRIELPGHLFSRIHVDDIAAVLSASVNKPRAGAIYNLCDDAPAENSQVIGYACDLLGVTKPPLQSFDEARKTMSPMALSFWNDNRRVDNSRIKSELGVELLYPDYRAGLDQIYASMERSS